jgi:hypothetical protein
MSSTVAAAVAQTVTFLIQPLTGWYNLPTLNTLKQALTHTLTAHYTALWQCGHPAVLNLAHGVAPPQPIYQACQMIADVHWDQWMQAVEAWHRANVISLVAKPTSLSVRLGSGQYTALWRASEAKAQSPQRTYAMEVLESDDGQDIFAELQNQVLHDGERTPNWLNNTLNSFPRVPPFHARSGSPTDSLASRHSRSSSFSSASSVSTMFSSAETDSASSVGSISPVRTRPSVPLYDDSKKDVTAYDGGKTTVLTGGVMLGGHAAHKTSPTSTTQALPSRAPSSWRSGRC